LRNHENSRELLSAESFERPVVTGVARTVGADTFHHVLDHINAAPPPINVHLAALFTPFSTRLIRHARIVITLRARLRIVRFRGGVRSFLHSPKPFPFSCTKPTPVFLGWCAVPPFKMTFFPVSHVGLKCKTSTGVRWHVARSLQM
jgi:hypothetical protein